MKVSRPAKPEPSKVIVVIAEEGIYKMYCPSVCMLPPPPQKEEEEHTGLEWNGELLSKTEFLKSSWPIEKQLLCQ